MQKTQNTIPEFLVENQNTTGANATEHQQSTAFSPLKKILLTVSAVWICVLLGYLQFSFGWQNLSALLPIEFVEFITFAFIPLPLILFLITLIFKTSATANQASLVEKSLNKILFNDNKNALAAILDQDLQKQIGNLAGMVQFLTEQTQNIKNDLNTKAEDFAKIGAELENNFSQNVQKLDSGILQFTQQCQNATAVSEKISDTLANHTAQLKTTAQEAADILNPLINESISSAEHFQNILQNNKDYITQANSDMNRFTENNHKQLINAAEFLTAQETKIEQAFLRAADSCAEIYKRLDSGISHIETSLNVHKESAAEQAALIDKNATYLDNKLGEYGKLISLEVEEMVKRSSTLELNVKKQLDALTEAKTKTNEILDEVNATLEQKSGKAVKNIEKIITNLSEEIEKLADFVKNTENKNNDIENTAEKITQRIGKISQDLSYQVDNLKNRSVEAIDKFNEVSGLVQRNTVQLSETASIITAKGKENNDFLSKQNDDIAQATVKLENIKKYFSDISNALQQANESTAQLFAGYKSNVVEFNGLINRQMNDLNESRQSTEAHLRQTQLQYEQMDVTNFIDRSSEIIQNLNNLSVDLHQFFNKDKDEELWKKFYSGDYSVFARSLAKNLTKKQIIKIREEYENNLNFRQISDRYISEFETIFNGARGSEKPQIIIALLSGSELGKIYYILATALDRLDKI